MENKKVLVFFTHYSSLYGANKSLVNLLEGLDREKLEIIIVMPQEGDLCLALEKLGFPYIIHDFKWWVYKHKKKSLLKFRDLKYRLNQLKDFWKDRMYNKSQISSLKSKLNGKFPDLVYSNSSVIDFGYLFAQAYNVPHIWHLREIQEHYRFSWKRNKSRVNNSFNKSNVIVAISNYVRKNYEEKIGLKDIKVIYDGVLDSKGVFDLDQLLSNKKPPENLSIVFGIIGLIHPNKGQEEAIRAFAQVHKRYKRTKLIIVGQGDTKNLVQLTKDLNLENHVKFMGHMKDPFSAFSKIDVTLMCSRMEGLGRVTIESMAAGIPIIGYKEGGTRELIKEGVNGLFYQKGAENLAEKMIYLIRNENERARMGANGRKIFDENYTSEIYGMKFMNFINELLEKQ